MATIIEPSGKTWKKEVNFKDCQLAVSGYVEPVYLPDGRVMLVNEEGLIYGLPPNAEASDIAGGEIVGTVVLLEENEVNEVLG